MAEMGSSLCVPPFRTVRRFSSVCGRERVNVVVDSVSVVVVWTVVAVAFRRVDLHVFM